MVKAVRRAVGKWSKAFWSDWAERVGATFIGALIGMLTLTSTTPVDWTDWAALWAVLGVPTALAALKGLLANMADSTSGASALPGPNPVLVEEVDEPGPEYDVERDMGGDTGRYVDPADPPFT